MLKMFANFFSIFYNKFRLFHYSCTTLYLNSAVCRCLYKLSDKSHLMQLSHRAVKTFCPLIRGHRKCAPLDFSSNMLKKCGI